MYAMKATTPPKDTGDARNTAHPSRTSISPTYIGFLVILNIPFETRLVASSGLSGLTVVCARMNFVAADTANAIPSIASPIAIGIRAVPSTSVLGSV